MVAQSVYHGKISKFHPLLSSRVQQEYRTLHHVKDSSEAKKSETDKNMAVLFNILRKHKKVGLQNLVLNRISFSQIVENIFSLSFLVKDGRVAIEVGEEKNLIVVPRNAPSIGKLASGDASYNQFVFRFDFSD